MSVPDPTPPPEFHRPLIIGRIGAGHTETLVATDAECAALALRMGLPAIIALRCVYTLRPTGKSGFETTIHNHVLSSKRRSGRKQYNC